MGSDRLTSWRPSGPGTGARHACPLVAGPCCARSEQASNFCFPLKLLILFVPTWLRSERLRNYLRSCSCETGPLGPKTCHPDVIHDHDSGGSDAVTHLSCKQGFPLRFFACVLYLRCLRRTWSRTARSLSGKCPPLPLSPGEVTAFARTRRVDPLW